MDRAVSRIADWLECPRRTVAACAARGLQWWPSVLGHRREADEVDALAADEHAEHEAGQLENVTERRVRGHHAGSWSKRVQSQASDAQTQDVGHEKHGPDDEACPGGRRPELNLDVLGAHHAVAQGGVAGKQPVDQPVLVHRVAEQGTNLSPETLLWNSGRRCLSRLLLG